MFCGLGLILLILLDPVILSDVKRPGLGALGQDQQDGRRIDRIRSHVLWARSDPGDPARSCDPVGCEAPPVPRPWVLRAGRVYNEGMMDYEPLTPEQAKQVMRQWKAAAPLLEEQRERDIRAAETVESLEVLSSLFNLALRDLPPRVDSGLIEMQRLFARLRQPQSDPENHDKLAGQGGRAAPEAA
jgi:hypothetical protein